MTTTLDALTTAAATDYAALDAALDYLAEHDLPTPPEVSALVLARALNGAHAPMQPATVERHFGWPTGTVGLDQRCPYRRHNETALDYARSLLTWAAEHAARHAAAIAELRSRAAGGDAAEHARYLRRIDRQIAEAARRGSPIGERVRAMRPTTLVTAEPTGRRLRVRSVDVTDAAASARTKALESGEWRAVCRNGGDVCNSYGYRADTEGVLAISDPAGRVVVFFTRLPANKVTQGGVAHACYGEAARQICDGRYGAAARADGWAEIKRRHRYLAAKYQFKG